MDYSVCRWYADGVLVAEIPTDTGVVCSPLWLTEGAVYQVVMVTYSDGGTSADPLAA